MTLASLALAAVRAAADPRRRARRGAAPARARRPRSRRSVLVAGFAVVLVLPIATAVLPALHLREAAASPTCERSSRTSTPDGIDRVGPGVRSPALRRRAGRAAASRAAPDESATSVLAARRSCSRVWALGAVLVLARLGVGLVRARRLVKSARFVETLDVGGRPVEVRISRSVDTPAVTGLLVPVVLLPHDADTWTAERRARRARARARARRESRLPRERDRAARGRDPLVRSARVDRGTPAADRARARGRRPRARARRARVELRRAPARARDAPRDRRCRSACSRWPSPRRSRRAIRALLAPRNRVAARRVPGSRGSARA